jgi:16S rRNA processing protein RimM
MNTPGLWACGIIGKAHGLRGQVYLNLAPAGLQRLSVGTQFYVARTDAQAPEGAERIIPCAVTRTGGTDQRPLVLLDLAQTREEAIALQGMELLASGAQLDAVPHYRVGDLLGLPVETTAGRRVGAVSDVLETPAHEILQVRGPHGQTVLLPLVDEVVTLGDGVLRVADDFLED